MRYKKIAGTDLEPSVICLGSADMGTSISMEESFRMLDTFYDAGGNFIDTALVYANWIPGEKSLSEKTIGKWMKLRNSRDKVILATKGAHPELSAMHIPRLSRQEIVSDLNKSLMNLGVECIDLYWLHRDDASRPAGEILETLNDMVKEGRIKYFGCSNWKLDRIRAAAEYADRHNLKTFYASQVMWSLAVPNTEAVADRTMCIMDAEMLNFHKESQLAAMPYSSQAKGFFQKMDGCDVTKLKDSVKAAYLNSENLESYKRVRKLAEEIRTSVGAVVLGYLTSQPFPAFPVIGPRSVGQLVECLEAKELELTAKQVYFLEKGG